MSVEPESVAAGRAPATTDGVGRVLERTSGVIDRLVQRNAGYEDRAARLWLFSSIVWLTTVDLFGLIIATEFVSPNLFGGIAFLEFGRVRPMHVNGVIFAWLSSMYWGGIFWVLPRLTGRGNLWGEKVAWWSAWGWNAMFLAGVITLGAGMTQGREYAELIWPVDLLLLAVWITNIVVLVGTVIHREVRSIYVTLWWFLASPMWLAITYAVGNVIWNPGEITGSTSGPDASGAVTSSLADGILNWWQNHNLFGLWLTPMLVALTYYFVPKITNTPLYSHTLSLISFWGLAFTYTGVGHHHLLQAPTPDWLKAYATVNSVLLLIPVFAFVINIWMTMRGSWERFFSHIPLRFILTGFIFYFLVNLQGAAQALPDFNALTHFTNFIVAHAHLALLGAFTFLGMGMIDYIVPQIYKRPLFSRRLEAWQYWMVFVGFTGFFWSLTIASFLQGQGWQDGQPEVNILPKLHPWLMARAIFGALIVISGVIFAYNIWMTVRGDSSAARERRTRAALTPAGEGVS